MKKLVAVWVLMLAGSTFGQQVTGDIVGTVVSLKTKEKLYGAKAIVEDNGKKYQAAADVDGRFRISEIPAGKYFLKIIYLGDTMSNIKCDVPIEAFCNLGTIEFESKVLAFDDVVVKPKMKLVLGSLPVKELTSQEISKSPIKFDVKLMASSMSSEIRVDDDGQLMFRGARKGDMIYVLDGIKCNEVFNVPSCAISRMMVYTGGLPAKYGDTLGGAIVVETKGYFDLYRAWEAQNRE
jgi:hypothetical protein